MGKNYLHVKRSNKFFITLIVLLGLQLNGQVVQSFTYSGAITQSFVVPPCVTSISLDVRGAQGANAADRTTTNSIGGLGGRAQGVISVTTGQILYIVVGGAGNVNGNGGFNGGGNGGVSSAGTSCFGGPAGGGGGGSDVRVGGTALGNRVIVGGGGGGSGRDYCNGTCQPCGCGGSGGGGGGLTGLNGLVANVCNGGAYNGNSINFGSGGGNTIGGLGGPDDSGGGNVGTVGALGIGGNGAPGTFDVAGGGGGGGYYGGGGGGGAGSGTGVGGGGGGGGSSYFAGLSGTSTSPSFQTGDGLVILSFNYQGALTTLAATPGTVCTGLSSTLSANGQVSYTWSPVGSNSNSIIVSPTVATTYTLQGTNSLGCVSSTLVTIGVDVAVPSLTVVSTASALCVGKSLIMTASGASTYTWTNGVTNGLPYVPAATTTFVVTGGNACGTSTAATAVTVNPLPGVTASVNNPTVCSGSTIILNGGGGVGNYTWTAGAPNNLAFVPPGTTTYSVTGASANGCTATAAVGVTVLVTPTITPVVTPTAICFGTNAVLSAIGATGYTWTPGTNLFASTATVSPPSSTTFTLFRTNGACSSTSTLNLVVNPLPLVNATASPSQICAGAGINLVVLGPVTNTWQPGGFTQSNLMVYPNFSTSYTVTGSNGSCTAQSIVPIVVNSSPIISIASSTNIICQGNSSTLTVSGTGAAPLTYTWGSGNNGTTEIVTPNSTTIITVSATNTLNCTSTLNQLIQVNPVPNMSLTANPSFICAGDQAVLSIAQATASTNNNVAYIWSTGGTGPNITASPTITTIYNTVGTNTLTGCQNSNSVTLAVYIATFSIISPTAICKGQTATLTAVGQPTSYVWTVVNGNNTAPSVTVSPVINTTYSVTGVNGSCNTSSQVAVIVNPIPNVTAIAAKNQICKFEISTITANGATSYSWSTGAVTQAISFTLSVTTNYTLTGTDLNGCAKTVTVSQFVATCLGIEDAEMGGNAGINVYPNPNNGNFTISSDKNITLNIINALGQTVNTIKLSEENKKEITVGSLPTGIYFISGDADGTKVNKKIIVER